MTFGQKLKQLRKDRGVTARRLAAEMQMDTAYLSRIENDYFNHLPARETIERIAHVLKLSNSESDVLHTLARKVPADVEALLFRRPEIMNLVRNQNGSSRRAIKTAKAKA